MVELLRNLGTGAFLVCYVLFPSTLNRKQKKILKGVGILALGFRVQRWRRLGLSWRGSLKVWLLRAPGAAFGRRLQG